MDYYSNKNNNNLIPNKEEYLQLNAVLNSKLIIKSEKDVQIKEYKNKNIWQEKMKSPFKSQKGTRPDHFNFENTGLQDQKNVMVTVPLPVPTPVVLTWFVPELNEPAPPPPPPPSFPPSWSPPPPPAPDSILFTPAPPANMERISPGVTVNSPCIDAPNPPCLDNGPFPPCAPTAVILAVGVNVVNGRRSSTFSNLNSRVHVIRQLINNNCQVTPFY